MGQLLQQPFQGTPCRLAATLFSGQPRALTGAGGASTEHAPLHKIRQDFFFNAKADSRVEGLACIESHTSRPVRKQPKKDRNGPLQSFLIFAAVRKDRLIQQRYIAYVTMQRRIWLGLANGSTSRPCLFVRVKNLTFDSSAFQSFDQSQGLLSPCAKRGCLCRKA